MSTYTGTSGDDAQSNDPVARYRYLLRTASPDQLEKAHEQAFASMTAQERQQVLAALSTTAETPTDASAASLARSATRLEMTQPGAVQQLLGSQGSPGRTLLTGLAAGVIGSAVWGTLTGNDGIGGRPGLLSRLLGMGGGLLGGRGGYGYGNGGGWGQGGGFFGGGRGQGGGFFGGGRDGGPGGFGGPGGPGGGPGGFGGPGGPGGFGGPGGGGPGGGPGGGGPGGGGPGGF